MKRELINKNRELEDSLKSKDVDDNIVLEQMEQKLITIQESLSDYGLVSVALLPYKTIDVNIRILLDKPSKEKSEIPKLPHNIEISKDIHKRPFILYNANNLNIIENDISNRLNNIEIFDIKSEGVIVERLQKHAFSSLNFRIDYSSNRILFKDFFND